MVKQEIAHREWLRYRKQQYSNQLARPSWDIVNPNWDKLEKEAVIPKEFEISKEEDIAIGLQGRTIYRYSNSGFFIRLRWLIGFFLPLTAGFSSCKLQVFPVTE